MNLDQTFSILFWLNKAKANRKGFAPIWIRITVDGKRAECSTSQNILAEQWDVDRGVATDGCPTAKIINDYLANVRIEITRRYNILLTTKDYVSAEDVKENFRAGPDRNFTVKPTRDVSFEFIQDGYEVIHRYSRLSFHANGPRTYCFDDLGAEQALKYYGNECNVMAEVILSRYEFYTAFKMLTHLTTNLQASEINTMYGPRVRSRMREMFNVISFDGSHKDKRQ